ncbi:MAG: hypothetical protein OXI30_05025 [Chloroflexota bacterium]|nr:hypothetical protein [Chloroflexota bacterium]
MTDLSLATLFTGAVILGWGMRSLRNGRVNAFFFKLRGRHSTWLFGFVSVIAGLLMLLSGLPTAKALSPELIETFAKSGLYIFGIGWALALVMEAIDRIAWRLDPGLKPTYILSEWKRKRHHKRKCKAERSGAAGPVSDKTAEAAAETEQPTDSVARLPD